MIPYSLIIWLWANNRALSSGKVYPMFGSVSIAFWFTLRYSRLRRGVTFNSSILLFWRLSHSREFKLLIKEISLIWLFARSSLMSLVHLEKRLAEIFEILLLFAIRVSSWFKYAVLWKKQAATQWKQAYCSSKTNFLDLCSIISQWSSLCSCCRCRGFPVWTDARCFIFSKSLTPYLDSVVT